MPYMPPELLAQSQLTPKADVYSFGIVMWELLSSQASSYKFSAFEVFKHACIGVRALLLTEISRGQAAQLRRLCSILLSAEHGRFSCMLTQPTLLLTALSLPA